MLTQPICQQSVNIAVAELGIFCSAGFLWLSIVWSRLIVYVS